MPREEKYTCDVCGAEKKATNHWMVAAVPNGYLTFGPFSEAKRFEDLCQSVLVTYLCGEKCVTTAAARWAAKQKGNPE